MQHTLCRIFSYSSQELFPIVQFPGVISLAVGAVTAAVPQIGTAMATLAPAMPALAPALVPVGMAAIVGITIYRAVGG